MSTKHTPTPWHNDYMPSTGFGCGYGKSQIIASGGQAIAGIACVEPNKGEMYHKGTLSKEAMDTLEANAEFIVRACNNHDALIEALGLAMMNCKNNIDPKICRFITKTYKEALC